MAPLPRASAWPCMLYQLPDLVVLDHKPDRDGRVRDGDAIAVLSRPVAVDAVAAVRLQERSICGRAVGVPPEEDVDGVSRLAAQHADGAPLLVQQAALVAGRPVGPVDPVSGGATLAAASSTSSGP